MKSWSHEDNNSSSDEVMKFWSHEVWSHEVMKSWSHEVNKSLSYEVIRSLIQESHEVIEVIKSLSHYLKQQLLEATITWSKK